MDRLKNKRAIVTGAASGIGKAIATRFSREGAHVIVADIDFAAAEAAAREIGEGARPIRADVTREDAMKQLIRSAVEAWGGLDIMVNNAGYGIAATIDRTEESDWDRIMAVNLKGAYFGMKHAIPELRKAGGGSIMNISSIAALVGIPNRAAYSAAKGGILSLTRAAAIDHVEENIRVNCIVPGTVDTPWVQRITADMPDPEAARAAMKARQPHGRLIQPGEIAAMALYLASDEAASVIGAAMIVDGGMTAR